MVLIARLFYSHSYYQPFYALCSQCGEVFPNFETSSEPQSCHKRAPNVLINLQAGHFEQGSGIDTILLGHLGILLVQDLLEEGKRYLHFGLGTCEPLQVGVT